MSTIEHPFSIDYDKRGAAKCKKCKQKIEKTALRIARLAANPFSEDGGVMKNWHHVDCLFETFLKARATTKKIDDPAEDIEGWADIKDEDKKMVRDKVKEYEDYCENKPKGKGKATPQKTAPKKSPKKEVEEKKEPVEKKHDSTSKDENSSKESGNSAASSSKSVHKDNMFKEFQKVCANISDVSSYLSKTEIVSKFFKEGSDGKAYKGDIKLAVRLLLPGVVKRVYNLQSKTLVKLFSQIFSSNYEEMVEDLEKGDVAETIRIFFESSKSLKPCRKSILSIQDVDQYLEELKDLTTEESQSVVLKKIAKRCTGNDLKMIIRLVKGDLRINTGAKHILNGLHPDGYESFQTSRNLDLVLDQISESGGSSSGGGSPKKLQLKAQVMTPVLPMLAEACRSVEQALKKCPKGMYAELKYDGERVQLHKKGTQFKYFSRSLKPVMPHKVAGFKDSIPLAFPGGSDLIIDAEVLLVDTKTNVPLPFGSLGKHKKNEFSDAKVCLFIFDCIHYNGQDLMDRPITERRQILEKNLKEIPQSVVLSEMKEVHQAKELQEMIHNVLEQGLEGLVLKSKQSIYEPGKRHWLKVKKDYLNEGAMADSADLVVLGAWYGTGKKGGMMSVFLMGCYNPYTKKWCTVTKVHTGHDDAALERLQTSLQMDKISQSYDRLPSWINCSKPLTPDFVAKDPKNSPVWEISGAEFTKNTSHTADGISIRFPRVTKVRPDRDWNNATDLKRLQELYEKSKEHSDYVGLGEGSSVSPAKKRKIDVEETENVKKELYEKSKEHSDYVGLGEGSSATPAKKRKIDVEETENVKKKLSDQLDQSPSSSSSSSSQPKKRRRDSEGSEEEEKKKKKKKKPTSDKEACNSDKEFVPPVSNPLPSVFEGVKMFLPPVDEDSAALRRYFIAYGGETVDEFSSEATHFILNKQKKKQSLKTAQGVSTDWLTKCIKLKKLVEVDS